MLLTLKEMQRLASGRGGESIIRSVLYVEGIMVLLLRSTKENR